MDLGIGHGLGTNSYLELSAKVNLANLGGVVFDHYNSEEFKFVMLDAENGQVVIGHHTQHGWYHDVVIDRAIESETDHVLTVTLKGSTASVSLDNQLVASKVFNAAVVDGGFGLIASRGPSAFDDVTVKTDDSAFRPPATLSPLIAAEAGSGSQQDLPELTVAALEPVLVEAMARWRPVLSPVQFSMFSGLSLQVADLPGLTIAQVAGSEIVVDANGAGHGWFLDMSPGDDLEFRTTREVGMLVAKTGSDASGRLDLLTAVMHELGHVLGLNHTEDEGLMQESLTEGVRYLPPRLDALLPEGEHGFGTEGRVGLVTNCPGISFLLDELEDLCRFWFSWRGPLVPKTRPAGL